MKQALHRLRQFMRRVMRKMLGTPTPAAELPIDQQLQHKRRASAGYVTGWMHADHTERELQWERQQAQRRSWWRV